MRASIFGLGYIGCATAVALAGRGHDVIGVDVDGRKVRMISRGEAPILEGNLDALIRIYARCGKLQGCSDAAKAVHETDVCLIAVESPAKPNGAFDYSCLLNAVWQVADGLKEKNAHSIVALRSAVPPGTTESLVIPELEKISGKSARKDFTVCVNPEFFQRASHSDEVSHQSVVIVGSHGAKAPKLLQELYQGLGKICCMQIKTAEMLKYTWDAKLQQTTLANEMNRILSDAGVDVRALSGLFESQLPPFSAESNAAAVGSDRGLAQHKMTTNH